MGILVEHLTTRSAARVGAGIFPREAMSSFDPSGQGAEHSATRRSKPWESLSLIPSPPLTVLSSLRACRRRIAKAGFDKGGWQVPYFDQESGQVMSEAMAAFDALLLGRKTYEIFASFWPHAPTDDPIAARLNEAPKYVASRTLDSVGWNNSTLRKGDIANEVVRLKETYNQVHTSGSANLVQSLMRYELVNQYNLWL